MRKLRFFVLISILICIFFRFFSLQTKNNSEFVQDREVVIFGDVCDEPDIQRTGIKLTICSDQVEGRVLVNILRYPEFQYGDFLQIEGVLKMPPEFLDFSYKNYLKRYGIYTVMSFPKITLLDNKKFNFYRFLFQIKQKVKSNIEEVLPEPASSLALGLLLGTKNSMPEDLKDAFYKTGLAHIVAISGYNITIIIIFVGSLLGFLGRRSRILVTVLVIFVFAVLVGASASVIRAAIMGSIGLAALYFGRSSNVLILVLTSALLMTLWNPYVPLYDVGFQLSFAAVLGIIYISPFLMKFFEKVPSVFALRESFALTLSAQIATFPLTFFYFKQISFVAPFVNFIVVPLIPFAMLFSFITIIISFISKALAMFFGVSAYIFLMIIICVCRFFYTL